MIAEKAASIPMKRMGTAEAVGNMALFIADLLAGPVDGTVDGTVDAHFD